MMFNHTSGRKGFKTLLYSGRPHIGCGCDGCGINPIKDIRFKCSSCPNFDFCEACMNNYDNELLDVKCGTAPRDAENKLSQHVHNYPDHLFHRIAIPLPVSTHGAPLSVPTVQDTSKWIYAGIACDVCQTPNIMGYRYFCTECAISMCEQCERKGSHPAEHSLLRMAPTEVECGQETKSEKQMMKDSSLESDTTNLQLNEEAGEKREVGGVGGVQRSVPNVLGSVPGDPQVYV